MKGLLGIDAPATPHPNLTARKREACLRLLIALDDLAELILNDDRLALLNYESPRAYEGTRLEILQLLVSGLEAHFDD